MFCVLFPMEVSPIKRVMVQSAKEAVRKVLLHCAVFYGFSENMAHYSYTGL